jgi:hypothetical protein
MGNKRNIHVIPTDKPSRVYKHLGRELKYTSTNFEQKGLLCINQNIYITSDEEIKEGDYMYDIDGDVGKAIGSDMKEFEGNKKIILTTDQDLIADGVQAIDDEFLEWFVKNPSCEEIETERLEDGQYFDYLEDNSVIEGIYENYKIILPKEEPKQDFILIKEDCPCIDECMYYQTKQCKHLKEEPKQETAVEIPKVGTQDFNNLAKKMFSGKSKPKTAVKPKQETLEEFEEAALKYNEQFLGGQESRYAAEDFIAGAKWQQERSYSEEEVLDLLNYLGKDNQDLYEWFNKFKKKQ